MNSSPTFNFNTRETYFYTDKYNLVLQHDPWWSGVKDGGKADSIGRTFWGYYCYRDERFIDAIDRCFVKKRYSNKRYKKDDYYYQGYRHIIQAYNLKSDYLKGLSRDHLIYALMAFKLSGRTEKLKDITSHLKWRISDFATFTPDSWLWMKTMGGSRVAELAYKLMLVPLLSFNLIWNKTIYKLSGFKKESHQDDFEKMLNEDKTESTRKYAKMLYPTYAMLIQACQIHFLHDGVLKRVLERILLAMTPRHNYVIQSLLRKKNIDASNVYNYKTMTNGRWSSTLEPRINDRDLFIIKDQQIIKENNIEKMMVVRLFEEREPLH